MPNIVRDRFIWVVRQVCYLGSSSFRGHESCLGLRTGVSPHFSMNSMREMLTGYERGRAPRHSRPPDSPGDRSGPRMGGPHARRCDTHASLHYSGHSTMPTPQCPRHRACAKSPPRPRQSIRHHGFITAVTGMPTSHVRRTADLTCLQKKHRTQWFFVRNEIQHNTFEFYIGCYSLLSSTKCTASILYILLLRMNSKQI